MSLTDAISICIPVYNGAKYIRETLNSVLEQKDVPFQVLVQDNASTDSTLEILKELSNKNSRLTIFTSDVTLGMSDNWNKSISRGDTNYIMLLSADDMLAPGFLEKCMAIFKRTNVDVVTTNFWRIKEPVAWKRISLISEGIMLLSANDLSASGFFKKCTAIFKRTNANVAATNHVWLKESDVWQNPSIISEGIYSDFAVKILVQNPFSINFTVFNRQSLYKIADPSGKIFTSRLLSCDYDLWYRIAFSSLRVYYSEEALGFYRIHDKNMSRNFLKMTRHAVLVSLRYSDKIKEKSLFVFRLSVARAIFCVLREWSRGHGLDRRLLHILLGQLVERK